MVDLTPNMQWKEAWRAWNGQPVIVVGHFSFPAKPQQTHEGGCEGCEGEICEKCWNEHNKDAPCHEEGEGQHD